jgi:hypothetical protein
VSERVVDPLDAEVRRIVDLAPKFTPEQRDAIAAIFALPAAAASAAATRWVIRRTWRSGLDPAYWSGGDNWSESLDEDILRVRTWPTKADAAAAYRKVHGRLPQSHKAVRLTEAQTAALSRAENPAASGKTNGRKTGASTNRRVGDGRATA